MDSKNERAGQLAEIVEPDHGPLALGGGDTRLPDGAEQRRDEQYQRDPAGCKREPVASEGLSKRVRERRLAREHRTSLEVPEQIVRQVVDGCVPRIGLLRHRFQNDRIEVASKEVVAERHAGTGGRARPLGLSFQHHLQDLVHRPARRVVRRHTANVNPDMVAGYRERLQRSSR